jgi:RNA polymerase sigma factor (sigma-70 family)
MHLIHSEEPQNHEEEKLMHLKASAGNILAKLSTNGDLTLNQRESLINGAIVYVCNNNVISELDQNLIDELLAQRLKDTLEGVLYNKKKDGRYNSKRKCPTAEEQRERHDDLIYALEKIAASPELRSLILEQCRILLLNKSPNENDQNNDLNETQTEDVVTNFLHHAFTNKTLFEENQALGVFKTLYLDKKENPELYVAAVKKFLKNSDVLLNNFIRNPQITDRNNPQQKSRKLVPKTNEQKLFAKWDIVLLQHGNLKCRNLVLLRYKHFISWIIEKTLRKMHFRRTSIVDDLNQEVCGRIMEKFALVDIKQGSPLNYLKYTIGQTTIRALFEMALIPEPLWLHYLRNIHQINPKMPIEELCEIFGRDKKEMGCKKIEKLIKRGAFSYVNLDKMVGDENDVSLIDLIPGMQTTETPESELIEKDVSELIKKALDRLKPRNKEIILQRLKGVPLKVIGENTGISKQRVQQIEQRIHSTILSKILAPYLDAN